MAWVQRVEQPDVRGTVGELGAGNPIIDEDAALVDVPAPADSVGAGVLDRTTDFSSSAMPCCSVALARVDRARSLSPPCWTGEIAAADDAAAIQQIAPIDPVGRVRMCRLQAVSPFLQGFDTKSAIGLRFSIMTSFA